VKFSKALFDEIVELTSRQTTVTILRATLQTLDITPGSNGSLIEL
jgi:hypothetical protein